MEDTITELAATDVGPIKGILKNSARKGPLGRYASVDYGVGGGSLLGRSPSVDAGDGSGGRGSLLGPRRASVDCGERCFEEAMEAILKKSEQNGNTAVIGGTQNKNKNKVSGEQTDLRVGKMYSHRCVWLCVCVCVCVCVRACVRAREVCVCDRERERGEERQRQTEVRVTDRGRQTRGTL